MALGCLALAGCVSPIVGVSTTSSLPLPDQSLSQAPECHTQTNGKDAKVYQCSTESGPLYITTVQDCSIPEKFTYQATTRQLFVGVMDLKVLSQDTVQLGTHKALRSVVRGVVDVDPVHLSAFTFRHGECVTDLIMWEPESSIDSRPQQAWPETFTSATTRLAERLVTSPLVSGDAEHAGG